MCYFTRRAHRYAVIGGKGYSPKITRLGKYRYVVLVIGLIIFMFDFGFVWIMMFLLSIVQYYQVIGGHLVAHFYNHFYTEMFQNSIVVASTFTSFEISFLVAVTALVTSIFFVLLIFPIQDKGRTDL